MAPADNLDYTRPPGAILAQDLQACIPLRRILSQGDLLYVLTPAAVPIEPLSPGEPSQDPFEPFGRALAKYHPWVRHVPYMVRDGITEYHASHLRLATAVIFVITGPPCAGQPSQVALSQIAKSFVPNRPQIVLTCCSFRDLGPVNGIFPTLVEIPSYSRAHLEAAADLLFLATPSQDLGYRLDPPMDPSGRTRWLVQEWDIMRDPPTIHELWCQCLPDRFRLDLTRLQRLLNRPGYSKHFVVREPATRELLGFCATYTTFIDNSDSTWIGCLAVLLVQPAYRRRGIGTSLHSHALRQLTEHRVSRLQLGSAFPRLLYGIPFDLTSEDWFRRRGWRIDSSDVPGCGQEACDWVLDFDDWRADGLSSGGLTFRKCEPSEFDQVLEFVARESVRKGNVGWYDQYYQLAGSMDIRDIFLGLEGPVIVATALSYIPRHGSRAAEDLPWARTISDELD
ncbi:beta-n-acetyltransferase [Niveomyces insectorum RCEF 264]|uniref:Beta-n-acetyltransferase n=1 Tax=Niveomyces insectorum RCEF 264 TaxID=1081102 RepID=A0A167X457_9HYPO|nr:beta-n-acetyltransferase [Niveomyces insectorum RCEF 264]